jgi:hypothetical protein
VFVPLELLAPPPPPIAVRVINPDPLNIELFPELPFAAAWEAAPAPPSPTVTV